MFLTPLLYPPSFSHPPFGIWRIMAQLLQGHLSHTGAQRCGFASKVTLLCQHSRVLLVGPTYLPTSTCLREREQGETNLGGCPTGVGRSAGDLKVLKSQTVICLRLVEAQTRSSQLA
jgi:hypothetical protein